MGEYPAGDPVDGANDHADPSQRDKYKSADVELLVALLEPTEMQKVVDEQETPSIMAEYPGFG